VRGVGEGVEEGGDYWYGAEDWMMRIWWVAQCLQSVG
jgi:hypothetical protein